MIVSLYKEKALFFLFLTYCFLHLLSFAFALDFYYYSPLTYFMVVASFILIAYNLYKSKKITSFPKDILRYGLLIFLILCVSIVYYKGFQNYSDLRGRGSVNYIMNFTQGIIAWSIIGAGFYFIISKTKYVFYLLVFVALIFIVSAHGIAVINHGNLTTQGGAFYTHLISSTYVFYLIFLCHAFSKNPLNVMLIIISILILYISGGRADLFIYLLIIFIYSLFSKKNINFIIFIIFIIFFILAALLFLSIFGEQLFGKDTIRFFNLLTFDENDISFSERSDFLHESIVDLPKYIFLGDPNYLIFKYNDLGKYIHNLLSMWQFYGFCVFVYLLNVIQVLFRKIMNYRNSNDYKYLFGFFIFNFSVISVLFAKSAFYYPFWFSIGYLVMYFSFESYIVEEEKING